MLTTGFYPLVGGAEKQIERVSRSLVQSGIGVTVVTRRPPASRAFENLAGVRIVRLPVAGGKALSAAAFIFLAVATLVRERHQFQVIHSHQMFSPSLAGWLAARLLKTPLVINPHRGGEQGDVARLLRHPRIGRLRLHQFARDAAAIVAISEEIRAELLAVGVPRRKIVMLGNGVDTTLFHPPTFDRRRLRQKLGLPQEGPLCLFAGRLDAIKGLDILLESWEEVPEPAKLIIVGDGPERARLQNLAAQKFPERVIFAGEVRSVQEYMQASDVWTLPSRGEGLPVSMLEAMACALPVVVTPVGAMAQVINNGWNGLVVPPDDAHALAVALNQALRGTPEIKALGRNARQTVLEAYDIQQVTAQHVALYREILS